MLANTVGTMEDLWHGRDAGAHCLLENTGDNWSDATAAGGFGEGKTGGFGSFTSQTPLLLVSSEVPPPCAQCPLPGDKEPCFFKT